MNPTIGAKRGKQGGVYAVEFSIVLGVLLTLIFGVLELARAIYVFNTLQEVSRRAAAAAAVTDFRDDASLSAIRQQAIFRTSAGTLMLGAPVTDANVHIDYLAQTRSDSGELALRAIPTSGLPFNPASNKQLCMADPNDECCIRFVRVRICEASNGDDCTAVSYEPLLPLVNLPINLPTSTTIVPAESLGFELGTAP